MLDTIGETNMDLQDLQDDRRSDLQFGEINEKIIDQRLKNILHILSINVHLFCPKTNAYVLSRSDCTVHGYASLFVYRCLCCVMCVVV